MQTFDSQQQVRSIEELLERTLYVKAKNVSIERLQAENADLRTKLDIAQDEVRRLLRPDDQLRTDSVAGLVRDVELQTGKKSYNVWRFSYTYTTIEQRGQKQDDGSITYAYEVWIPGETKYRGTDEPAAVRAFRAAAGLGEEA